MGAETCLQKSQYVGVLAFATTDEHGAPRIRSISAIHYESEALYFFTAKGRDFCHQLLSDGRGSTKRCSGCPPEPRLPRINRNGLISFLRNSPIYPMYIREIHGNCQQVCPAQAVENSNKVIE